MKNFDLNPPPEVLLALTHTALKPIDALCELIDNAADSFHGNKNPPGLNEIKIELPTTAELSKNEGAIRIIDNGPGMTAEEAENALTAGYTSKRPYGQLGMFGMGLNIAAGKFARKTRLITATKNSESAISVEVDLAKLVTQKNFQVQPTEESKAMHFGENESGTIIELTGWWGQNNPNNENPKKLIQRGPGKIREIIGRRYATLLHKKARVPFKITVKEEVCIPFEHCVWAEHRFVKKGSSQIHAQQIFDDVLHTQYRCMKCNEFAEDRICPIDDSHPVNSVEERVHGWIGVQRYDDPSHYGIDLIRNGRTIRILEKVAFFQFVDDSGKIKLDYPIDSIYGRIVGEVHLDHVRVDFAKQDFDRSAPEWQRAIDFLRGTSSLQPKQPGASENDSPVMRIYKGYRRVRKIGLADMYMGESQDGKPTRISREIEREFLDRFTKKEDGYYDDTKWWEKVEEASQKPDNFVQCPQCDFQNSIVEDVCQGCNHLLKAKECISCDERIPQNALQCEHCGQSQIPEGPWECDVCGRENPPDSDECRQCGKPKGSVNIFSKEFLLDNSEKDKNLSVKNIEIILPGGEKSVKFELDTRTTQLKDADIHLPAVIFPDIPNRILQIFIDVNHPLFISLQLRPEHTVSAESAAWIHREIIGTLSKAQIRRHNLTLLQGILLKTYWEDNLTDDIERVRKDIDSLLEEIHTKIADSMQDIVEDIYNGMSKTEIDGMLKNMQEDNAQISEMGALIKEGKFLFYVPPKTIISIFSTYPEKFFDGRVWDKVWSIPDLPEESVNTAQQEIKENYLNNLEDIVSFLRHKRPSVITIRRAKLSIEFLQQNIVD